MKQHPLKVISASRRIEMVGFFPDRLIEILQKKCPPERVHTIVLWSKDPRNLLKHHRLRKTLSAYAQLFLHFTISGMGQSFLEPRIPSTKESLSILSKLVAYLGDPRRMRVRFDPIVHLRLENGRVYTNLNCFRQVAIAAQKANVSSVTISWMEAYPKVVRRLKRYGIEPICLSNRQWAEEKETVLCLAKEIGIEVLGCCVSGMPVTRCIDGRQLTQLHTERYRASQKRAKGQRHHCGCTESWDIGWYNPCPGGCVYCYANPVEYTQSVGRMSC